MKEIVKLYDLLLSWQKDNLLVNSGFGNRWLVNYAVNSGCFLYDNGEVIAKETGRHIIAKGELDKDPTITPDSAIRFSESMHGCCGVTLWKFILDRYAPNCKLLFSSINMDSGDTYTNDEDLATLYLVDISERSNHCSKEEANALCGIYGNFDYQTTLDYLKRYFGEIHESVDEYEDLLMDDYGISIHTYESATVEEMG